MTYYSFTSLATIGFGDFHAIADEERIITIFVILFGGMIFSYFMGEFIEILQHIERFQKDLDDGDELEKFFGLLKQFNNGQIIHIDLKHRIERHFNHKWRFDRNQALDEPEELSILEQLPTHVIDKIYRNFLYE